jgi:hypothetical protein
MQGLLDTLKQAWNALTIPAASQRVREPNTKRT